MWQFICRVWQVFLSCSCTCMDFLDYFQEYFLAQCIFCVFSCFICYFLGEIQAVLVQINCSRMKKYSLCPKIRGRGSSSLASSVLAESCNFHLFLNCLFLDKIKATHCSIKVLQLTPQKKVLQLVLPVQEIQPRKLC